MEKSIKINIEQAMEKKNNVTINIFGGITQIISDATTCEQQKKNKNGKTIVTNIYKKK